MYVLCDADVAAPAINIAGHNLNLRIFLASFPLPSVTLRHTNHLTIISKQEASLVSIPNMRKQTTEF